MITEDRCEDCKHCHHVSYIGDAGNAFFDVCKRFDNPELDRTARACSEFKHRLFPLRKLISK